LFPAAAKAMPGCLSRVAAGNAVETLVRIFSKNAKTLFFPCAGRLLKNGCQDLVQMKPETRAERRELTTARKAYRVAATTWIPYANACGKCA